jgi:hypothetical protein
MSRTNPMPILPIVRIECNTKENYLGKDDIFFKSKRQTAWGWVNLATIHQKKWVSPGHLMTRLKSRSANQMKNVKVKLWNTPFMLLKQGEG